MIDLHSHILPELDDGPKTPADSIALAGAYEKAGFSDIVATPHWVFGTNWMPAAEAVLRKVADVNREAKNKGLSIAVHAGMEVALGHEIVNLIEEGRILSLARGPYILIEAPFQHFPPGWEQILFSISVNGYKIILAHPERSAPLLKDSGLLKAVLTAGVYLQINSDSLSGSHGKRIQQAALDLIRNGQAHCLATDSHDARHRSPDHFRSVLNQVAEIIGPENTRILTRHNPANVLQGREMISLCLPEKKKTKPKYRFF